MAQMEEMCPYREAEHAAHEYIHVHVHVACCNDGNRMESERECKARPRLTAETGERARAGSFQWTLSRFRKLRARIFATKP